ncbi:MAG: Ig-like domain-containing protein, partial [Fibrobacteraceae bacterium]|nr:Ig-like domain-containing protein [Fibrobacteraceae bacterium]
ATFTPSYNWEKRNVANLPTKIPAVAGVGGRFGKMPEYNQEFGQSNKAPTVSMTSPAALATFDVGDEVAFSANAADADGKVSKVDFFVGNTLVGSATVAPYQVSVKNLAPGTYSAVAVASDNSGLSQMSSFVTFRMEGGVVEPKSSSSEEDVASSSSVEPQAIAGVSYSTEAVSTIRIFDMQGRPLFTGTEKPLHMKDSHVIVVEYDKTGLVIRRYIQK